MRLNQSDEAAMLCVRVCWFPTGVLLKSVWIGLSLCRRGREAGNGEGEGHVCLVSDGRVRGLGGRCGARPGGSRGFDSVLPEVCSAEKVKVARQACFYTWFQTLV